MCNVFLVGSRCQNSSSNSPSEKKKKKKKKTGTYVIQWSKDLLARCFSQALELFFRTRWTEWEKLVPLYISMIPFTMIFMRRILAIVSITASFFLGCRVHCSWKKKNQKGMCLPRFPLKPDYHHAVSFLLVLRFCRSFVSP